MVYALRDRADLVIDISLLTAADLQQLLTGHFAAAAHIERDPDFAEGKAYLRTAVGCTRGRPRMVHVAERVTERLRQSRAGPAPTAPGETAAETG